MNKRRDLLTVLAALLATSDFPFARSAPAPGVHRIGFLAARSRSTATSPDVYYDSFMKELSRLGYAEGKNLVMEWRFADGKYDRLPALAVDLAASKVEVIVTHALPPTIAAMKATSTIPIVFASMVDPVANRVVPSLSRPGGNVTGLSLMGTDITPKRLEILSSLLPRVSKAAFLVNPLVAAHPAMLLSAQRAGGAIGVKVVEVPAKDPLQLEQAFAVMVREHVDAVIVPDDTFFLQQRRQICALALKYRIPSLFAYAENVESGGLASYGQNLVDYYRKAAVLVDKILHGAKPAELPIEQPMKFELVINTRTASQLELKLPPSVLLRADRVIE